MRSIHAVTMIATVSTAILFGGCEKISQQFESETDAKAKAALIGIWFRASEEIDEMPGKTFTIHSWIRLSPDGKFMEHLRGLYPDGRIADAGTAGSWYVTDGMFKQRFESINGKNLRRNDLETMYVFQIVSVSDTAFTYFDPLDFNKKSFAGKRVSEMGKEP